MALLAGGTGCVHRELVGFADHASKPLTSVQAVIHTSYFFSATSEYAFYSCAEQGDKLTCKRLCGGDTDLVCPTSVGVYGLLGAQGNNIR
jgi:hypothetical protein